MDPSQSSNAGQNTSTASKSPSESGAVVKPLAKAKAYFGSPGPTRAPESSSASPQSSLGPNERPTDGWKSVVSLLGLIVTAILIAFSIITFALRSYRVDGQSMETTLHNSDRLIVYKLPRTWARITGHDYIPHRGDIIVFEQGGLSDSRLGSSKELIKRVVGLPGDRIVVKDGELTVYNKERPNGFKPDASLGYSLASPQTSGDVDLVIGTGQLFVAGDNRPNSEDSRFFGPISAKSVVGKLVLRLLPISQTRRF